MTKITSALIAAVFCWSYAPTILDLFNVWGSNPDYSHGYAVVPMVAFLAWVRRDLINRSDSRPSYWGLAIILVACAIRWASARYYIPELDHYSIVFWLGGTILLLGNRQLFRWAIPLLIFLFFMCPLPSTIELAFRFPLQRIATHLSEFVFQLFGRPAIAEGNILLLGDLTLEVEQACSGLRMFFGVFALVYAAVLLHRKSLWQSSLLLLAAAPIAICANVIRIVLTGFFYEIFKADVERALGHDLSGLLMLVIAFVLCWALSALLQKIENSVKNESGRQLGAIYGGILLASITLFFGIWFGVASNQRFLADSLFRRAQECEADGDIEQQRTHLTRMLKIKPDHAEGLNELAEIYQLRGDAMSKRKASELFKRAFIQNPARWERARKAIQLLWDVRDIRSIIRVCDKGLSLDSLPEESRSFLSRKAVEASISLAQEKEMEWDQVVDRFHVALKATPSWIEGLAQLSRILRDHVNDSQEADHVMQSLTSDHKNSANAWYYRYLYDRTYRPESIAHQEAELPNLLQRALQLDRRDNDRNVEIPITAGNWLSSQGKAEEARRVFEEAKQLAPSDFRPYLGLATLHGISENDRKQILRDGIEAGNHNQTALVLPLAELLIRANDLEAADQLLKPLVENITRINGNDRRASALATVRLQASVWTKRNEIQKSKEILEAILATSKSETMSNAATEEVHQIALDLHELYVATNHNIESRSYLQMASRLGCDSSRFHTLMSHDLERRRQPLGAIQHRKKAADLDHRLWADYMQLRINYQIAERGQRSEWNLILKEIKSAPADIRETHEYILFKSQVLLALDQRQVAAQLLRERYQDSQESQLLPMLIDAELRNGNMERASRLLEEFGAVRPGSVDVACLRAAFYARQSRYDEALDALDEVLVSAGKEDAIRLKRLRAQYLFRVNKSAEAIEDLESAYRQSGDLIDLSRIAEFHRQLGNWEKLAATADRMETSHEGETFPEVFYRCEAIIRLHGASSLETLEDLYQQLRVLANGDPRTQWVRARLSFFAGQFDEAIATYEQAWSVLDDDVWFVSDYVAALIANANYEQAVSRIALIRQKHNQTTQWFDAALSLGLANETNDDAMIRQAEKWVETSRTPESYVRLIRVYLVSSNVDHDHLDSIIDDALVRFPNDFEIAKAVANYHAIVNRDSTQVLNHVRRILDMDQTDTMRREMAASQLFAAIGDTKQAINHIRLCLESLDSSYNVMIQKQAYSLGERLFFDSDPNMVLHCCRELHRLFPNSDTIRLRLVEHLVTQNQNDLSEARELLDNSLDKNSDSYRRTLVRLCLANTEATTNELTVCETELRRIANRNVSDELLMLRLLNRQERFEEAIDHAHTAIQNFNYDERIAIAYVTNWSNGRSEDRQHDQRFKTLLSQLHTQNKTTEVLQRSLSQLDSVSSVRRLFESVKEWSEVDRLNNAVIFDPFLMDACRRDDGDLLVEFVQSFDDTRSIIYRVLRVLTVANPTETFTSSTERKLKEILELHSSDAEVRMAVGDYWLSRRAWEKAEVEYERHLTDFGESESVLNNLVTALLHQPNREQEALQLAKRNIASFGRTANLLDSLATAYVQMGHYDQARQTLQEAIDQGGLASSYLKMVTILHEQNEERQLIIGYLRQAINQRLDGTIWSQADRESLAKMTTYYSDRL